MELVQTMMRPCTTLVTFYDMHKMKKVVTVLAPKQAWQWMLGATTFNKWFANIEMTDGDGHTALLRALKDHDNELAWALIEAGADVNAKGAVDLKTPLHRAATAFSNHEVGLKLIQEGNGNEPVNKQ